MMLRKRMNEECCSDDDEVNEDDGLYENKIITCEHILSCKNHHKGFHNYRTIFELFVLPRNRKRKASQAFCWNTTCSNPFSPRLHACLYCQFIGCYSHKHIHQHSVNKGHNLAMDIVYGYVYCFSCNNYIFDEEFERLSSRLRRNALRYDATVRYEWQPSNYEEDLFHTFCKKKTILGDSCGLRGLINLGSTCFMNCIVQALVHTPPLRNYFLSDKHNCKFIDSSKCLVCEMSQLVQEFYSGKNNPHIPYRLLHLVWTHAKHLAGYEQQDAHEFFISTLDILHRHSSGINDISTNKQCNCIIDKIFTGSLQSDVVCQACGGVSSVEDPIWDFSLDLVNSHSGQANAQPISLYDCLRMFTRTEHLGSSKIKCNNCDSYQESTKQLSLKKLPIVASFHLKRFEQSNKFNKKISKYISFPVSLDMTPFTSMEISRSRMETDGDDGEEDTSNRYSLFAVVNHSGTLETGHYTVFIRPYNTNDWFKCDDHFVMKATEKDVLNSECYLLFYYRETIEYK